MGNLRLVRSVGRVPAWFFEDIPEDRGRSYTGVITETDIRLGNSIFESDLSELPKDFEFAIRFGQVQGVIKAN